MNKWFSYTFETYPSFRHPHAITYTVINLVEPGLYQGRGGYPYHHFFYSLIPISMKNLFLLLALLLTLPLAAVRSAPVSSIIHEAGMEDLADLPEEAQQMSIGEFLTLTPKTYREKTGKKLGWFKKRALAKAQDKVRTRMGKNKNADSSIPQALYIVLAIFALGWLAMGILDDFEGNNWLIGLLLTILFVIPGIIYSLIKMGDYY